MQTDYQSFHSKKRASRARKLITRNSSRVMFLVCIGFTVFILGLLGLVTGYLFSIGFTSLSWDFFTQLPSGRTDSPIQSCLEPTIEVGCGNILPRTTTAPTRQISRRRPTLCPAGTDNPKP